MGVDHTTENPCVMVRTNHKTKSCECIIIHQDELYIASSTIKEILHILKEKYKIEINSNDYLESNFPYDPGGTMICSLQFQLDTQQNIHINISYIKFHEIKHNTHEFILYIQETSYMKWKPNTA